MVIELEIFYEVCVGKKIKMSVCCLHLKVESHTNAHVHHLNAICLYCIVGLIDYEDMQSLTLIQNIKVESRVTSLHLI